MGEEHTNMWQRHQSNQATTVSVREREGSREHFWRIYRTGAPQTIASVTWQEASCRGTTRTNISDIIYHQPACHSTNSPTAGVGKKIHYRRMQRTLMSCLRYPWVCCQKIIMPINFTHAGVAFLHSAIAVWW